MEIVNQNITHCTPAAKDLLPNVQIKCFILGCSAVFTNLGNLDLHLSKHHKVTLNRLKSNNDQLYFCPEGGCIYNEATKNGKHFKCLKYLRQHYQKVHAEKKFPCTMCPKKFVSQNLLTIHSQNCGRKYICAECQWSYDSREALLTHCKRKGHRVEAEKPKVPKIAVPQLKRPICENSAANNRETQTENNNLPPKITKISSVQTDNPTLFTTDSYQKYSTDIDEIPFDRFEQSMLCDIETQTEMDSRSASILDHMLYSNMHTQTCDEFLSELGLADIQTQTNWSSMSPEHDDICETLSQIKNEKFITGSGAHDELLVSTETQTSFTQCLLESCHEDNSFGGCTLTQHTQTCDTLLEGLFGSQENDLIGCYQSTHTQT